jgi:hypothetical protein
LKAFAILLVALLAAGAPSFAEGPPIAPPPAGKLYQGFYWGGVGSDTHDPTEHDVTSEDLRRYEEAMETKTTWVYFSNNWFESRKFPVETCAWIRSLGKIPYVRLMLRSDVDQKHSEKTFTLTRIGAGEFDSDLRAWAQQARRFGWPVLIEWGTEPNGEWFAWNGKWNGRAEGGAARYVAAYRHIVDIMRGEGAANLQWVWHVNWYDEPQTKWNRLENYFPGESYCDWVGLSAYGPTTPTTPDGTESLSYKLSTAYPRLTSLVPEKPIILAEFGCDLHNSHVRATRWAAEALETLFSNRWPAIIGFCWWNEGWQNDDVKKHDSDLIITHDRELTRVFREELTAHRAKIQEEALVK